MSRITGYSLTMPFAPRMSRAFRQEDLLGPHRARVLPLPEAPGEERHLALDEASHARPRHALLLAEELVQPVVVDLARGHRDPLAARGVARPQAGSYKLDSRSITRHISVHLETLKVFCDVVETRSFSAAASQNFVTQSAVSQQIRTLEDRYGRRLLERTRGNVQLTPAGEILYQVSKEIVQRYQDMEARLQALANVIAGTVRVATVHSIGLYELSAQIKRYLKAYPQVHLHLAYSRSSRIYEDVLKGNVDIGVVAYPSRPCTSRTRSSCGRSGSSTGRASTSPRRRRSSSSSCARNESRVRCNAGPGRGHARVPRAPPGGRRRELHARAGGAAGLWRCALRGRVGVRAPAGRALRPHRPPSPGALRERDRADRALPPRHAHERRAAHRRAAARPARLPGCGRRAHVGPRLPHTRRPRRCPGGRPGGALALDRQSVRRRRGMGGRLRARRGRGAALRGGLQPGRRVRVPPRGARGRGAGRPPRPRRRGA